MLTSCRRRTSTTANPFWCYWMRKPTAMPTIALSAARALASPARTWARDGQGGGSTGRGAGGNALWRAGRVVSCRRVATTWQCACLADVDANALPPQPLPLWTLELTPATPCPRKRFPWQRAARRGELSSISPTRTRGFSGRATSPRRSTPARRD